jgi:hypothetical protein
VFVDFTLHPCLINRILSLRPKDGIRIVLLLIDTYWASRDGFQGRLVMHQIIGLICPFASITATVDLATGTTKNDIQDPCPTGAYQSGRPVELAEHPRFRPVTVPVIDDRALGVGAGPEAEHITKEEVFP